MPQLTCVPYVLEDYWTTGYTVCDLHYNDDGKNRCFITSEAKVLTFALDPENVCRIVSDAVVTFGLPGRSIGTGTGDCGNCSDRLDRLEKLVMDFLKPEDIQPLFNKNIEEVIFHV